MPVDPAKIAACGSEHAHQVATFVAISQGDIRAKYPELMLAFAIPNGGERNKIVASKLKAEGAKAGVWDIFLPVPVIKPATETDGPFRFNGLWVEMKAGKNYLTKEQLAFYHALGPYGYQWAVCYTWMEAITAFKNYLGAR